MRTTAAQLTNHHRPPVLEFRVTVGARPTQDGRIEVTVGRTTNTVTNPDQAMATIATALDRLVRSRN